MTSNKQISLFGETESTSLQGDSHANHIAKLEAEKVRKMIATSGRKCIEQYAKFNRPSLWQKTFVALLIGTGEWFSNRCRLTWKMKATKSHRFYFQLQVLGHRTKDIGFGLLGTPRNSAGMKSSLKKHQNPDSRLEYQIVNLLPTPQSHDMQSGSNLRMKSGKRNPEKLGNWRGNLKDFAQLGMLPTPSKRDYKGGNSTEHLTRKDKSEGNSHQDQLPNFIKLATGSNSQLNPRFVAEMMGFHPNYTELPFLRGAKNLSKRTETQ